jgi:hypothetical protein
MLNYKTNNAFFNTILVFVLVVLSFDLLTKFLITHNYQGFTRYSAIPKLLLEIGLFVVFVKNIKDNRIVLLGFFTLISIVFLSFFMFNSIIENELLFQKVYNLNKYLYLFLFAETIFTLKEKVRRDVLISIRNIFIFVGFINGLFILIGSFFEFEILRSYYSTGRFGYDGLFLYTSGTSYIYVLLIITVYYEYIKKKTKPFLIFYFIIVSLFIGTKAIWLLIILLAIVHLLFNKRVIVRNISILGLLLSSLIGVFFYKYLVNIIVNSFSFGQNLYAEHGFLSVLTSTRDLLLKKAFIYIQENWTPINYFIGGIDLYKYGVEFEFVDIFLFFGLIGLVVYLFFVKRVFFYNNYIEKYKILLFIVLMLIVALAGNFFMNIISSIFAFSVFYTMYYIDEV